MCQNTNIRFNSYILEVYHTSYFDWFEKEKKHCVFGINVGQFVVS